MPVERRQFLIGLATISLSNLMETAAAESKMNDNTAPAPQRLAVSELLMYATVRLELPQPSGLRTGTGFFFNFFNHNNFSVPAIVTNAHVVRDSATLNFRFMSSDDNGLPIIGQTLAVTVNNLQGAVLYHPNTDLAIIPIGQTIQQMRQEGKRPFFAPFDQSLIPDNDKLKQLVPLESVVTVGYPGQFWDNVNNLPLFHRGSTATPAYIDFQGRQEFLVDFATWPGASGSPVLIFNEGSYFDSRNGSLIMGSSRMMLIGVVYGVATQEVTGKIVIQQAPTIFAPTDLLSSSQVPTNLGACIRASKILDFEPLLVKLGVIVPDGYVMRATQ